MTPEQLEERIERAAGTVGSVWPLHSFVTANPLSGFEDRPFHEAVAAAEATFGGRGYPHPSVFRTAWEAGRIDPGILRSELADHGVDRPPERTLEEMAARERGREAEADDATATVDRVLSKWLAAFLDEGRAQWPMPDREAGFFAAWRRLAPHDGEVPGCRRAADLPETPTAALEAALSDVPRDDWTDAFEHHLAALPGWTGFIKQRASAAGDPWADAAPVSLLEYLAVRLTLADLHGAPIAPTDAGADVDADHDEVPLPEIWLTAWERSYRERLLESVDRPSDDGDGRPAAQLVFCIDTRSEVLRRHLEAAGPYETHGYAGFFGVPMRYEGYEADVAVDACPPVVDPEHRIVDRPTDDGEAQARSHDLAAGLLSAGRKHLKALKTNLVAAFTFVEGAGGAYGTAMAARTLAPRSVRAVAGAVESRIPSPSAFCTPAVDAGDQAQADANADPHADADPDLNGETALPTGMTLEEKVTYAANAFELMGWESFARLVVFTGHTSETTNNPFDSSLDCGACAGNPGGPSARVLATICNDPEVRAALADRGVEVPPDTVFVAAEHNTTTDEVTLFDAGVPESHREDLERLRRDLEAARAAAAAERVEDMAPDADDGVREVERRAADWAETRPEWGLAGNAAFVVGPRELTEDRNLDGRAFLHSYDPETDPEGEALEAIMTGPLVVTQWINNQYYFATVDDAVYGSGSKVTQNPVGNVGVFQGNGGDLMGGLPRQSLFADDERPYHQPLRLTAVIHAPTERVTDVLEAHPEVARLFDNGWADLSVLDPTRDGDAFHYEGDLEWEPALRATAVRSH